MKNLAWALTLLMTFIFTGCLFNEPETAGTEDFPNTIQASIDEGLAEGSGFNDIQDAHTYIPSPTLSAQTNNTASPQKLLKNKTTGNPSTLNLNFRNLLQREDWVEDSSSAITIGDTTTVSVFLSSESLKQTAVNTIAFLIVNEDSLILSSRSEVFNSLGNLKTLTLFTDYDGDGLITPIEGQKNQAAMLVETYTPLNIQSIRFISDAGEDNDFGENENGATLDNKIVKVENTNLTINRDTLSYESSEDADGDGFITPTPGGDNKAKVTSFTINILNKYRTQYDLIMDAGPDEDFGEDNNAASEDNRLYSFQITETKAPVGDNSIGDSLSFTEARDLDGDGIISALPSNDENKALFYKKVWLFGVTIEEVAFEAGKDKDFDTEGDNQILYLRKVWLNEQLDTLTFEEVTDADGDDIAIDTLADSATVTLHTIQTLFPQRAESWTTMVIFPKDSTLNYPIKYNSIVNITEGLSTTLSITGTGIDSVIDLNDTVYVKRENSYETSHNRLNDSFTFKMGLGDELYQDNDNVMYQYYMERNFKEDESRPLSKKHISFEFISDEPVLAKTEPEAGTIQVQLQLQNDDEHSFKGHFDSEYFEGTYTKPDGTEISGKWPVE